MRYISLDMDLYGRGGSETDGIDFFVFNPDDPINWLTVNEVIVNDPSRIAAAASPSGLRMTTEMY